MTDLVDLLNEHDFKDDFDECVIFDMAQVDESFEDYITYRYDSQAFPNMSFEIANQLHKSDSCVIAVFGHDEQLSENLESLRHLIEKVPKYTIIVLDNSKTFKMEKLGANYLLRPILKVLVSIFIASLNIIGRILFQGA